MVPMHLGLIDGPFVPHNLVTTQYSPVPLPKFQMAPRLKILMSSGSKKGAQIYYPFLSIVPARESPPGSPTGPLWREIPVYRAFLRLSKYTGNFIMYSVITNIYYRKTVGHVFTKPVQIEGTTQHIFSQ